MARRRWKWALWLAACIGSAIAALDQAGNVEPRHDARQVPSRTAETTRSFGPPATLPARGAINVAGADLFAPRIWTASPPRPSIQATEAPAAPMPPTLPYRFAGTVEHDGMLRVVLAAGDRVHLVNAGEVIDELYFVREITRETATLVYTPLGIEQHIAYASHTAFSPSGPIGAPVPVVTEERRPSGVNAASPAPSLLPPGSPLAAR